MKDGIAFVRHGVEVVISVGLPRTALEPVIWFDSLLYPGGRGIRKNFAIDESGKLGVWYVRCWGEIVRLWI